MNDLIIALPLNDIPDPLPSPSVSMADNGTDIAYLTNTDIAEWPATAWLVGAWDGDTGEPLSAITDDYVDWIRPLGNDAGVATGLLDSMRWQGHSEAKLFEYDDTDPDDVIAERYPTNNRPYDIEAAWFWQDGGWPGWYIRFTLKLLDGNRDPSVRSISVYNDAWVYQYNLGAWTLTDVDGNFYLDIPAGFQYDPKEDVNFAATWAAAIEGKMTLKATDDSTLNSFWQADQ